MPVRPNSMAKLIKGVNQSTNTNKQQGKIGMGQTMSANQGKNSGTKGQKKVPPGNCDN